MRLQNQRLAYRHHFDWFEGRTQSLYQVTPTAVNGLIIVPPALISTRFNYFAAVSRFFADAMLGDLPFMQPQSWSLIENLTEHWSVTGEACIVLGPTGYRAIRPDYVHPQFDPYDRDTVLSYVFVFPMRQDLNGDGYGYADKARVITYDVATGAAKISIREYREGYVADDPIGEPITLGPVIWIHTNDGVYADMEGIVREVTVRLNILQIALNSVSFPLLQIDTDAISKGALQTGVTSNAVTAAAQNGLGLTVDPPFIGEEGARYIERTGEGLRESLEYIRVLLGQAGVISGVPDYVFGVQLGRPANETERVLFAGQAKVNRFRRDIELAFSMIGTPIKFAGEPFVTRSERIRAILEEHEKGVSTVNEAREGLGRPPLPGGNVLTRIMQAIRGDN